MTVLCPLWIRCAHPLPGLFNPRWAKGGVVLQGARESVFTTKADHSFFTEPVSCLVFNAVGKTNVSILVDVHCESLGARLTLLTLSWPTSLTTAWSERTPSALLLLLWLSIFSSSSEHLLPFSPAALLLKHKKTYAAVVSVSPVGPILLVEPQPKTVDVDSDVTLNCKWAGNPPLTLTWFKKGSNMVRGQDCRFVFPVHSTSLFFLLSIFFSKGKLLSVHANAAIVHRSHYFIQCQLHPVQSRTHIVEHLYCRFLIKWNRFS